LDNLKMFLSSYKSQHTIFACDGMDNYSSFEQYSINELCGLLTS
ncbi:8715_t:CDS:1, partial [Funneliformis mosseae]